MPIEIGDITLSRIHQITTIEQANFASHRIPGLEGNVVQNMGRDSVRLQIEGIYYGEAAQENLASLRNLYIAREPVDFLAEIVGQAYFSQVILEGFEVWQSAQENQQFSYILRIAEYVPPPEPLSALGVGFSGVDDLLGLEALDFMDMLELPDLLSVPDFFDPTIPLNSILQELDSTLVPLNDSAQSLSDHFGTKVSTKSLVARSASSAGEESSLFDEVRGIIEDNQLLEFIFDQVKVLGDAKDLFLALTENPPDGIGEVGNYLSNLSLPDNELTELLLDGLKAIQDLIPSDVSGIIGNLSGEMDTYFQDLNSGLTAKIADILGTFRAIHEILNTDFTFVETAEEEEQEETQAFTAAPFRSRSLSRAGAENTEEQNHPIIDSLNEIQQFLDIFPTPFTVVKLLSWIHKGLDQFSPKRNLLPIRYLPLVDELREKLSTVLAWEQMDGQTLGAHLAESIGQIGESIQRNFYQYGVDHIKTEIENCTQVIDVIPLRNALIQMKTLLGTFETAVNNGDLTNLMPDIEAFQAAKQHLDSALNQIQSEVLAGKHSEILDAVHGLRDNVESRMFQLISDLDPPSDLMWLGLLSGLVENNLESTEIQDLTDSLQNGLGKISGFINGLNLAGISNTLEEMISGAAIGVEDLRNLLLQATVEVTVLFDDVEEAINQVKIEEVVEGVKTGITDFKEEVIDGIDVLFAPIRNILLSTLRELKSLLQNFNPASFIEDLQNILKNLTDLLSNQTLLDALDVLRKTLVDANKTLDKFSFTSVTDIVVDAIGVVEGVLKITTQIPLPDSVKEDVKDGLEIIPKESDVKDFSDELVKELIRIINKGPKPILETIRDKPRELVEILEGFSPQEYLGEHLVGPYQKFLSLLEENHPSKLFEIIQEKIDELKEKVQSVLDPRKWLTPLKEPYALVLNKVNAFDPDTIVEPLQEKLTAGIQFVTNNIPLETTNAIFGEIGDVNDRLEGMLDMGTAIQALLNDIQTKVMGLVGAEIQMRDFGQEIANKLDSVTQIEGLDDQLAELTNQVDALKVNPLSTGVLGAVDALISDLENLSPQTHLTELLGIHRSFPSEKLTDISGFETEKQALQGILATFDPLDEQYSVPLQKLDNWNEELILAKAASEQSFVGWDDKFHGADSPLLPLMSAVSVADLKTIISTTVSNQLTDTLAPFFKIAEYLQAFASALLDEFDTLVQTLKDQVQELTEVGDAFETLQSAINQLVDTLENFDISFLSKEIKDIFEATGKKIEALDPEGIISVLDETLTDLLDSLNFNTLLKADQIDEAYAEILDYLQEEENDPTKKLATAAQEEYDKVVAFIHKVDFSEQIDSFLKIMNKLLEELQSELIRTAEAYGNMIEVIPDDLQASVGLRYN